MKKKLMVVAMAAALVSSTAIAAYAYKCTVKSIDGKKVTLECAEKDAKKLKVGGKAKVQKKTCKVKSVDGSTVVVQCKEKDTKKLAVDAVVKVKKRVEGC